VVVLVLDVLALVVLVVDARHELLQIGLVRLQRLHQVVGVVVVSVSLLVGHVLAIAVEVPEFA